MDRLVHLGIYKGGDYSEISAGTQGEYGQWNDSANEENILVHPLPLMSKGESDLVWWLPSSPKGEIVGIMIQVLSLMATHSEVGTGAQRLVQVMAT